MAEDVSKIPYDVKSDNKEFRSNDYYAPRQDIPEIEKNPKWFWDNVQYILKFYNRPVGTITFPNAVVANNTQTGAIGGGQRIASDLPITDREYPIQFMIRMMQYYLGKQPNLNFNWLTTDTTTTNMQAQWIKGQEVSEFVNFFKGSIMGKIGQAFFTAKPMSKDAVSEREDMYNSLMLKLDLKPVFDQLAKLGAEYKPANGQEFEMPEQVEKWMDTDFKEFGAEMAGDMANGIWFTNNWTSKALQAFMHVTITSLCAMEHYVENGRSLQRIRMPYQLIIDNRIDDDYGRYDEFIGVIDNMTPFEIFRRYPSFTPEQREEINYMARNEKVGSQYNTTQNLIWWNYGPIYRDNTISVVTAYWRTLKDMGYTKKENTYGIEKIKKKKKTDTKSEYVVEDICKTTIVGNRYILNTGYVDNLVEETGNKSRPLLPIIRFRPNTFLGESISEVARIHRIQDELDMYDFKIRDMIGRAKGKGYILRGSKLGTTTPKTFYEDMATIGVHILEDSGEPGDPDNDRRMLEMVDMTLDPSIQHLAALYTEKRERMGRILNTSSAAMGQVTKYLGLGSLQNAQQQSNLGVAYLMDGFMDWLTMNMRYAVNQQVKVCAFGKDEDISFLIGDRGMAYIKLLDKERLKFEDFFTILQINDVIDDQRKTRMLTVAQAQAQNGQMDMLDFLKLEDAKSMTELQEDFSFSIKQREKKAAQAAQQQTQTQQLMIKTQALEDAELIQLKEDNATYRKQLELLDKQMGNIMEVLKTLPAPPPSGLQTDIAISNQQKQAEIQQAQQQAPAQQ